MTASTPQNVLRLAVQNKTATTEVEKDIEDILLNALKLLREGRLSSLGLVYVDDRKNAFTDFRYHSGEYLPMVDLLVRDLTRAD